MHYYSKIPSPLGTITLQANDRGLCGVWFSTHTTQPTTLGEQRDGHALLLKARQQLNEYFVRQRTVFTLPLAAQGTAFQQQVWHALCEIPFGEICSYQTLAERVNRPKAARAVGSANGRNPLSIIVPCHRVVAQNGSLAGYAGGTERKAALLALEGIDLAKQSAAFKLQSTQE